MTSLLPSATHQQIYFLQLKLARGDSRELGAGLAKGLLGQKFTENSLWFNYEPVGKEDFEEKVVRHLEKFSQSKEFAKVKEEIQELAKKNGYNRVQAFLIELSVGPVEALRQYVLSGADSNYSYLFVWIKKKLNEIRSEELKLAFSREFFKHISSLV